MIRTQAATCTLVLFSTLLAPTTLAQVQVGELTAPTALVGGSFGNSLDQDAGRLIVGASDERAYVYRRDGGGWALEAELASPNPNGFDAYGSQVAIDGEWAVVAARFDDSAAEDAGAVYVYKWDGATWTLNQTLIASAPKPRDHFGQGIALDAGRLVVGAPGDPDGGEEAGNAYIFEFLGFGWLQLAELAVLPAAFDRYGSDVAIEGDWVVVGAGGDSQVAPAAGAAHVWRRTATGWVYADKLVAPDGGALHDFGRSVGVSGGRVAVGAPLETSLGALSGAVYVFTVDLSGAAFEQKLTGRPGSLFGSEIALLGDELWTGAPYSEAPTPQTGAVLLHRRGLEDWSEVREIRAGNGATFDFFGSALSVEGDLLLVAGPLHDTSMEDAGTVYEFDLLSFAVSYCACASEAPCANTDGVGGCANSSGGGARLGWAGSGSTVADDLELHVTGAPAGVFGLACAGRLRARTALGDGLLCLDPAGGLQRLPVQVSGADGSFVFGPGLVDQSGAWTDDAIAPGTSWNFQCWFRDPNGPCGSGSNLSDAVDVAFSL